MSRTLLTHFLAFLLLNLVFAIRKLLTFQTRYSRFPCYVNTNHLIPNTSYKKGTGRKTQKFATLLAWNGDWMDGIEIRMDLRAGWGIEHLTMLIMSLLVKFVKILILVKQGCQFKLDSAALANKIWNGKFLQKFRDIQFMLLLLDSIFPNQLMHWEYPPPALFSFSHWHNCTFRERKRKQTVLFPLA